MEQKTSVPQEFGLCSILEHLTRLPFLIDAKGPKNQGRHQGPTAQGEHPSPMSAVANAPSLDEVW